MRTLQFSTPRVINEASSSARHQRVSQLGCADVTVLDACGAQVTLQAPAGSPFSTANIVLSSLTIPGERVSAGVRPLSAGRHAAATMPRRNAVASPCAAVFRHADSHVGYLFRVQHLNHPAQMQQLTPACDQQDCRSSPPRTT